MDFLCLYVTLKLSHCPIRPLRTALAALLGAVWALAVTFIEVYANTLISHLFILASTVICAAVMVAIAKGERKASLRQTLFYIAVSTSLGGAMTALFGLITQSIGVSGKSAPTDMSETSPILFITAALISAAVSLLYGKIRESRATKIEAVLTLSAYGKTKALSVLSDSGNLLCDPISGKPVIIISSAALSDILPEDILKAAKDPTCLTQLPTHLSRGLHLIPAKSVTGHGLLLCFSTDGLWLEDTEIDGKVAIDTSTSEFGGCDGIIPQILLDI